MVSLSPSATRIETTSTLAISPITVMHWVRSRSAPETGDVIGVDVGVDGLDQPEIELLHQLEVAVDLLEHRIDDQRLTALPAGEKVAVGAGNAVEQLAEDHGPRPLRLTMRVCRQT